MEYNHENKFQSDLQDFLDKELNDSSGIFGGGNYVVSTERGVSRGDVVIDDLIGIELKRNFSNSQKKKLRGQLEDYADNYEYVIACACGIDDMDGWRELQNKYTLDPNSLGIGTPKFAFVHKKRQKFGTSPAENGSSNSSGDMLGL